MPIGSHLKLLTQKTVSTPAHMNSELRLCENW
nr:MAG TPA: hypothetical protein [Caudoviricetes sp.]